MAVADNGQAFVGERFLEGKSPDDIEKAATQGMSTKTKAKRYCQIFASEFIATGFLMYMVCLSCLQVGSNSSYIHIQGPLTSGFAVTSTISAFGHISDCHMNPAVTAAFWSLGKIRAEAVPVYIIAQLAGASAGVGLLKVFVPLALMAANPGHCETNPQEGMSIVSIMFFEFFLTSLLIFLVCSLLDVRNSAKQDSAPVKFGLCVAGLIFSGVDLSGGSLNPARSFAPSLWNGHWSGHWAYWAGQIPAGLLVPQLYKLLFEKDYSE